MAPKRSTPIWPSTRCSTCTPKAIPAGSRPLRSVERYIKAIGKGILKVMSKMGISTYQSYCGAQIFDAVGLSSEFVDKYFTGTATMIEGVGLSEVAEKP
jgi:glutamate synthase (NADPH/NADH) large chain